MPAVSEIGNPFPVQPSGGAVPDASAGQSFPTALAQAASRMSGSGTHHGHGGAGGGTAAPFSATGAPHSGGHTGATASVPNGGTHPQHFSVGGAKPGGEHGMQETVLALRAYRQQLIASNIANADTPGYKAVDIDFQEALRIARSVGNASSLTLAGTAPGHIAGRAESSSPPYPLRYHSPAQPSADGNTVEMDVERSKFAENSVMWEFSRDRVSGHYKMMMELFQNLKN